MKNIIPEIVQMFQKPFRTKSSTTVRNSDRRKLRAKIGSLYPEIPEDVQNEIVPQKGDLKETKIITHKGEQFMTYLLEDEPLIIQNNAGIAIPYLYALWKYNLKIPTLHTHPDVVQRLAGKGLIILQTLLEPYINPFMIIMTQTFKTYIWRG